MATNIKKAGSAIRKSFRSRRYTMLDAKENNYILESPAKATSVGRDRNTNSNTYRTRSASTSESTGENGKGCNETVVSEYRGLKRGSKVTQSMRDAVGTIRQKLKMSTRRMRLHSTPTRAGKRRNTMGGRDVQMYSPFKIETPGRRGRSQIKTCLSQETPTRLRREVEALTANMQALSALTPNTLQSRSKARKTQPLTNGSLKTPKSSRRRITTDIY